MATVTGSGTLSSAFSIFCPTGFIPYEQGLLDQSTGYIKPLSVGQWLNVKGKTWNTWNNFQISYQQIRWTAPLVDVGEVKYFNLNIELDFDGVAYYLIHTSETGLFAGEETEYLIKDGDYNVAAFYGRYAYVTVVANSPELRSMTITASNQYTTFHLQNVNTATLGGSTSARTLTLTQPISSIVDMQIQPKTATTYNVNLYVSDTATSTALIPMVISKSMPSPSFVMRGIDNDPRDGIVDITITALPKQVMTGGNLVVIE